MGLPLSAGVSPGMLQQVRADSERRSAELSTDLAAEGQARTAAVAGLDGRVTALQLGQSAGTLVYATVVALNADLAHPDKAKAEVYADPGGDGVNGVYQKNGASGVGGWVRLSPLAITSISSRLLTAESGLSGLQLVVVRAEDGSDGIEILDPGGFVFGSWSADALEAASVRLGATSLRPDAASGELLVANDQALAGLAADMVRLGTAGWLRAGPGEGVSIESDDGWVVMEVTSAGVQFKGGDSGSGPAAGAVGSVEVFIDGGVKAWVDGKGAMSLTPTDDGTYRTVRLAQDGTAQAVAWLVERAGVIERGLDWLDFGSSLAAEVLIIVLCFAAQQSNSAGVANNGTVTNANPLPGRIAMFSGGVRVLDNSHNGQQVGVRATATNLRHLVDAVEVTEGTSGETGWVRYGQRLVENDGAGVAALVGTVGISGQPYNGWKRDTPIYKNLMQCVRRARYMAARLGATLDAQYFPWCGGESDKAKTRAAYLAELQTYRANLDTDVKAILPAGAPDVVLAMWQFSSWQRGEGGIATSGAAQAMVQAEIDDPVHFVCTGPAYPYPYDDPDTDGIHLTPLGQALQKETMALARNLHKAGQWPGALRLLSAVRTGSTIVAKVKGVFDGLVLDTTNVTDPGNYGLEYSQVGGTPATIAAVAITGTDEITVTLSGDPGATSAETLGAGLTGIVNTPSGPTTGPRTCFRDSRTWASVIAGQTLRHWMVAYPVTVTH